MSNQQEQQPQWPPQSGQPSQPPYQPQPNTQYPSQYQQPRTGYTPPPYQQQPAYRQSSSQQQALPYSLTSRRSPRPLYFALAFFGAVGLLFVISLLWSLFPSQTQGSILSLEPSCTIGFSGTSVTFTIQGWTAQHRLPFERLA